jgi:hypothetical protein
VTQVTSTLTKFGSFVNTENTPPTKGPIVAAGVCLTIAIVLPLLVWTYAKTDPELWGIPFFFWYQFLLVFVSVALTSAAYRLVIGHERQRRAYEKSLRGNGETA